LTVAEESLRNQSTQVASLEASLKKAEDRAEEAERLKDQLDEYKHGEPSVASRTSGLYTIASDKLSRAENALEKYKKKLEDAADLRLSIKACFPLALNVG
jgi:protein HOOK3